MHSFKIGQKVRIVATRQPGLKRPWNKTPPFYAIGEEGVIVDIYYGYSDLYDCSAFCDCATIDVNGEAVDTELCYLAPATTAGAANKLSPQCELILAHLRKGHSITQRSALMDFGVMALPRRIKDLRERGYPITSEIETNKLTGQRYARYSLEKETLQ